MHEQSLEQFIETVKSSIRLSDEVSKYVKLRRHSNGRHTGLCPFHAERTPSFGVHQSGEFYKCFGCQESGDLLTFRMKMGGMSFMSALKGLADDYCIPIPPEIGKSSPEQIALRQQAYQEAEEIVGWKKDLIDGLNSHWDSSRKALLNCWNYIDDNMERAFFLEQEPWELRPWWFSKFEIASIASFRLQVETHEIEEELDELKKLTWQQWVKKYKTQRAQEAYK